MHASVVDSHDLRPMIRLPISQLSYSRCGAPPVGPLQSARVRVGGKLLLSVAGVGGWSTKPRPLFLDCGGLERPRQFSEKVQDALPWKPDFLQAMTSSTKMPKL